MNEMYDMSIVTHNYGVMLILGVIFYNFVTLSMAQDVQKYKRMMNLFMPIGMTMIGTVLFTGIVMMAAKHLDFTIANIIMILIFIALVVLENIKSKRLRFLDTKVENSWVEYKNFAKKIFALELFLVLAISSWMWI